MSAELKGVCSPSFDSWLIVSQAVANVALAAEFKKAGRCRRFVDQVRTVFVDGWRQARSEPQRTEARTPSLITYPRHTRIHTCRWRTRA